MKRGKKAQHQQQQPHTVIHQSVSSTDTHTIAFMLAHLQRNLIKIALMHVGVLRAECTRLFSFVFFFFFDFCFIIPLLRLIVINALDFVHFLSCLVDVAAAVVALDTLIVLGRDCHWCSRGTVNDVYFLSSSSQALMLTLLSSPTSAHLVVYCFPSHEQCVFHTQPASMYLVLM